jgi:hypothetical protein
MMNATYTTPPAIIAIVLALFSTDALAQSRTYYDSSGRVSGRSTTGTNGATTFYGSDGRVTGRASTSSNGTRRSTTRAVARRAPSNRCRRGETRMHTDTVTARLQATGPPPSFDHLFAPDLLQRLRSTEIVFGHGEDDAQPVKVSRWCAVKGC